MCMVSGFKQPRSKGLSLSFPIFFTLPLTLPSFSVNFIWYLKKKKKKIVVCLLPEVDSEKISQSLFAEWGVCVCACVHRCVNLA